MDDVKDFAKKYWPYLVGGAVGLFILMRMNRGSSGGGATYDNTYAALLAQQSAAGAQNAQIQAQADIANRQLAQQEKQAEREHQLNLGVLATQKEKTYSDALTNFHLAQAEMAKGIGGSAGQVIAALNAPAIASINSAAQENAYALMSAAEAAGAGFAAQSFAIDSISRTAVGLGQAVAGSAQSVVQAAGNIQRKPGPFESLLELGAGVATTYYAGRG